MTELIRVALVDDHEIVRRGLRELLESAGDLSVVAESSGFVDADENLDVTLVDIVVLDVRLGDGNGVDLCRHLIDRRADLPCLMLTSFADDEALEAALLAGAKGFVLKNVRGTDLIDSVRRVAAGESLISESTSERVRDRLRRRALEDRRLESLSAQERRILELLSEGLTNREIADEMFLAEKTVKNYVSNLLAKLGFQRRTEAALFAQKRVAHNDSEPTGPTA